MHFRIPLIIAFSAILATLSIKSNILLASAPHEDIYGKLLPDLSRLIFGEPLSPKEASFDLIVDYSFKVPGGVDQGKRFSFPLPEKSIDAYRDPISIWEESNKNNRSPMIWLNRQNDKMPLKYTLVVIGNKSILSNLLYNRTRSFSEIFPNLPSEDSIKFAKTQGFCPLDLGLGGGAVPVSNLADDHINSIISTTLRAEVVGQKGSFLSMTIDAIDFQPDEEMAHLCYTAPNFLLLEPSHKGWQNHRLLMIQTEFFGPFY